MTTSKDSLHKLDYATPLIQWFKENKRDMPWRRTSDPYCIWVSEVMLQQTQVATVIPYYIHFMERFPTVSDLAKATLEEVHNYWQGLGYYRRGENLWKGAKVIEERWQGEFPRDPKLVSEIPGIGPYTLGAVCSIAFHMPLPAVDGNVMRVMSRWYRMKDDIGVAKNRKLFEEKVMENMPDDPNNFNQALMELGALICTPKNPKCESCPIQDLCQAHAHHEEEQYPIKEKKIKKVEENYAAILLRKEDTLKQDNIFEEGNTSDKGITYSFEKRPEEGLLANLWGVPMVAEDQLEALGISLDKSQEDIECLKEVTHIFTHKKWKMTPYILEWTKEREEKLIKYKINSQELAYWTLKELEDMPVATAYKKIIKQI